ncbi:hypothetical protein BGZ83_007563 [Gryganskiella cystojenkinii]|nr:hypothetical protein BGZ83_007563 [Gryganskiella cystojenkinii]
MGFFKSSSKTNKNASSSSASVASTPAQTPRSSINTARPGQVTKMTREQALQMIMEKSLGTGAAMSGNIRL